MRTAAIAAVVIVICSVPVASQQASPSVVERRLTAARAWVSIAELAAHTRFLSSDPLLGRAPGTQGGAITARYVASQFERIGLLPGGPDGSYFQSIQLLGMTPSPVVMVGMGSRTLSFNYPADYVVRPERPDTFLLTGGALTFVGYGVNAPQHGWDDFKATPLNGSVLLVLPGLPNQISDARYADIGYKTAEAAQRGATGLLFVHSDSSVGLPWPALRNRWTRELVRPLEARSSGIDFTGWITHDTAKEIFAQAGVDWDVLVRRAELREFRPVDVGAHLALDIESKIRMFETSNVIGMIRGSDVPERSVLITANIDDLGVQRGAAPDSIFNGARIGAANLSGLLTMAGALTAAGVVTPTTLKFVAATAGESGELGIESFIWGLDRNRESLHAAIVIEEANLWGPTSDIVVAGGEDMHVDRLVLAAAAAEGLTAVPRSRRYWMHATSIGTHGNALTGARVPYATIGAGSVLPGNAPSARELAISSFYERHFNRTSDNFLPEFDFRGLQSQVRFAIRLAWSLSQVGATPTN